MLEPKVLVNCIHDLAVHNESFCEWLNAQDDRYLEDYIQGSKDVSEALNKLAMVCADMPENAKDFCMKVTPATVILRKDTNHYYPAAFLPPRADFCHDDEDDFWWQYEFTFCCPVESDEYNSNLYELKRIMQKTLNENPARVYKTDNGFPIVEILRMQIVDDTEKVIDEADQYDFNLFHYAESVKFRFGIKDIDNLDEALQYIKDHNCTSISYVMKMPVRDIVLGKTKTEEYTFQCGYRNPAQLLDVLKTSLTQICY